MWLQLVDHGVVFEPLLDDVIRSPDYRVTSTELRFDRLRKSGCVPQPSVRMRNLGEAGI